MVRRLIQRRVFLFMEFKYYIIHNHLGVYTYCDVVYSFQWIKLRFSSVGTLELEC